MKRYTLFISWLLACVATLGSILVENGLDKAPCTLCWYQRIVMFPLVIILGIATFRKAHRIVYYALPLSVIGMGLAIWQLVLIWSAIPIGCKECRVPGTGLMISFPILSLIAFTLITIFLIWEAVTHKRSKKL